MNTKTHKTIWIAIAAAALAVALLAFALFVPSAAKATDPPPGVASAYEIRSRVAELPAGVDSFSGSASLVGCRGWSAVMLNSALITAIPIPGPQVQLDGVSSSWAFTPPPGPFPLTASQASLAPGAGLGIDQLSGFAGGSSRVNGISMTTGYDLSRSVSVTSNPDGSSTAHVTVTLTPTDPEWLGNTFSIDVSTRTPETVDSASVSFPDLNGGAFGNVGFTQVMPTFVLWNLFNPVLGHPYTLTLDVYIPAGSGDASVYRPTVSSDGSIRHDLPSSLGPSAQIHDVDLGGTYTFSADADVKWIVSTSDYYRVDLAGKPPASPPPGVASAHETRGRVAELPGGVDAISGSASLVGWRGWSAGMFNSGVITAIPSPQVQLDGVSSSWAFTPPPGPFPRTESLPCLELGTGLGIDRLSGFTDGSSRVNGVSMTTGYDLSRSVSATANLDGSSTAHVTVTLTPTDPEWQGNFFRLAVRTNPPESVVNSSVSFPDLSGGAFGNGGFTQLLPTSVLWDVSSPMLGHPYTLRLDVHIPAGSGDASVYRPFVSASGSIRHLLPSSLGLSAQIHDVDLGGTYTFSAAADEQWILSTYDAYRVDLAGKPPAVNTQQLTFTTTAQDAANNTITTYSGRQ
jgi:opacity protein-like surface antigen